MNSAGAAIADWTRPEFPHAGTPSRLTSVVYEGAEPVEMPAIPCSWWSSCAWAYERRARERASVELSTAAFHSLTKELGQLEKKKSHDQDNRPRRWSWGHTHCDLRPSDSASCQCAKQQSAFQCGA